MTANYLVIRDTRDEHLHGGAPGLLIHMRDTGEPPNRLVNPATVDGEEVGGRWVLAYWDAHAKMGVFYPLRESEGALSEAVASEYLATGLLPPGVGEETPDTVD